MPKEYNKKDWIGAFAVTAGNNVGKLSKISSDNNNDYESIMIKIIGDRIAEAMAEKMHELVRRELWGYDSKEKLFKLRFN